ncbi:MAG: hypothetical protein HFI08_02670 [Bacilli bacterium]|nr:hypothetical protein [Bacilli bacterium]
MISINDMSHGFSLDGAQQYFIELNAKAIDETKELLGDITAIQSALEAGWQGQAEVNFMENFKESIIQVQSALDNCSQALNSEFNQITSAWMEQDTRMIEKN